MFYKEAVLYEISHTNNILDKWTHIITASVLYDENVMLQCILMVKFVIIKLITQEQQRILIQSYP